MRLGVFVFPTASSIGPTELARELEDRGFDGLFIGEHTHIPVSRETPFRGGGPLPDEYRQAFDPFVSLAAAAAVTSTLMLGTSICLVAQRDHVVLAKEVATVDQISAGRFVFGTGYGWNVDEIRNHGIDPATRRLLFREKVLAMKELWANDIASFDGQLVRLSPSWQWPKPVQRPNPPILIGGYLGPSMLSHLVEFADGWLSLPGPQGSVQEGLARIASACQPAGRDPSTLSINVWGPPPRPEILEHYIELGVDWVILQAPSGVRAEALAVLDRFSGLRAAIA